MCLGIRGAARSESRISATQPPRYGKFTIYDRSWYAAQLGRFRRTRRPRRRASRRRTVRSAASIEASNASRGSERVASTTTRPAPATSSEKRLLNDGAPVGPLGRSKRTTIRWSESA
jgi:hypothetical protein